MNARVIVGQRVKDFLETLAPVPRRKLWRGLKRLAQDGATSNNWKGTRAVLAVASGSVARDLRTGIGGGPTAVGLFFRGSPGHGLCRAGAIARVRPGGRVEALSRNHAVGIIRPNESHWKTSFVTCF